MGLSMTCKRRLIRSLGALLCLCQSLLWVWAEMSSSRWTLSMLMKCLCIRRASERTWRLILSNLCPLEISSIVRNSWPKRHLMRCRASCSILCAKTRLIRCLQLRKPREKFSKNCQCRDLWAEILKPKKIQAFLGSEKRHTCSRW